MALANGPRHSQWKHEAGGAAAPGIYRAPGDVSAGHHWQLARARSGWVPAGSGPLSRDGPKQPVVKTVGKQLSCSSPRRSAPAEIHLQPLKEPNAVEGG